MFWLPLALIFSVLACLNELSVYWFCQGVSWGFILEQFFHFTRNIVFLDMIAEGLQINRNWYSVFAHDTPCVTQWVLLIDLNKKLVNIDVNIKPRWSPDSLYLKSSYMNDLIHGKMKVEVTGERKIRLLPSRNVLSSGWFRLIEARASTNQNQSHNFWEELLPLHVSFQSPTMKGIQIPVFSANFSSMKA